MSLFHINFSEVLVDLMKNIHVDYQRVTVQGLVLRNPRSAEEISSDTLLMQQQAQLATGRYFINYVSFVVMFSIK